MDWRSLVRVAAPTVEPVTAWDAYQHLRLVEDDSERDYAAALIGVAREFAEQRNGMSILPQSWRVTYDHWWETIVDLPMGPMISVTSIEYLDTAGVLQTLPTQSYVVLGGYPTPQIAWAPNVARPSLSELPGSVRITYQAGYPDPASVPQSIRQAILLLVGQWFENREPLSINANVVRIPMTVDALLDQTRVRWW